MVFTSLSFVFLILPLFLAIDSLMRLTKASTLRNSGLLFVSLLFYTWGEAANVLLLVALAAMNYAAGNYLSRSKNSRLVRGTSTPLLVNVNVFAFNSKVAVFKTSVTTFSGRLSSALILAANSFT